MENKDKNIDKHFRKLTEEQEPKSFPNMDKVWDNIEQKLDQKDKKKAFPFWKYAGIAAAVLVFVSLSIQFINNQPETEEFPLENNQRIVIEEKNAKEILDEELKSDEDIYAFEEEVKKDAADNNKAISNGKKSNTATTKIRTNEIENKTILKEVQGIVKTQDGDPISGALIMVAGTATWTESDIEGRYIIKATSNDKLKIEYSGYYTPMVDIPKENEYVTITLTEDRSGLSGNLIADADISDEEYDRIRKERLNTSKTEITFASTVTSKTIEGRPNASFIQTLQGQVPGLNIRSRTKVGRFLSNLKPNFKRKNKVQEKIVTEPQREIPKEIPKVIQPISIDTESYENFTENPFESAKSNPVSTFSIDVDNAAYTNIRRFINNGQTVPKDAVRIEEMINFFKYDYPQPTNQHPFSINTEYSDTPWNPNHKLLKIGLKGKEIPTDKLPKSNFVFLVDVSGSMSAANKLPLLQASMKVLLDELRPDDRVSIVYYANNVGVLLEPTLAKEKEKIIEVIDNFRAGGGTSGGAGLELAYEMAEKHFVKNGNNRIILATDGDFNIGKSSDKDMQELIEEKRKSGVFLTCLGFGMGNYKDSKMITLAKKGNGNYAYIDNIQEANRFLGKEFKGSMFAIAKDVKIQIEFNPAHVQAYRLIGYEMRKLRNEDFTNDAIDAGELGSGHTVTALYEVIPNGIESEFYSYESDLKYTKNKASDNFQNELATVKFRYKNPKEDKSIEMVHTVANRTSSLKQASKDFKFSSAVAWFGLKLRDSKLITNKESTDIVKLAREGIQNDTDGYKAEFIRLVESVK